MGKRDLLFSDAAEIVVTHNNGSVAFLQRKLRLGFMRSARIIDQLEACKILGPHNGNSPRAVLVKDITELKEILNEEIQRA